MPQRTDITSSQMQTRAQQWEEASDGKAVFLRCYLMMTENVLTAVDQQEFNDPAWVNDLLKHFADFYFEALQAYEDDPESAPAVWRLAHDAADDPKSTAMQNMLLGVNAHINYDLVLTLVDMLQSEWVNHSEPQRNGRYTDHCHINEIIGRTINDVQDQVLEPAMPIMDIVDKLLGPMDEKVIVRLIAHWREQVWQNATRLLEMQDQEEQKQFIRQIEQEALQTGKLIRNKYTDSE